MNVLLLSSSPLFKIVLADMDVPSAPSLSKSNSNSSHVLSAFRKSTAMKMNVLASSFQKHQQRKPCPLLSSPLLSTFQNHQTSKACSVAVSELSKIHGISTDVLSFRPLVSKIVWRNSTCPLLLACAFQNARTTKLCLLFLASPFRIRPAREGISSPSRLRSPKPTDLRPPKTSQKSGNVPSRPLFFPKTGICYVDGVPRLFLGFSIGIEIKG